MTAKVFVEGMTCMHCAHHVEEALKNVGGVKSAKVDLKGKVAVIEHDAPVDAAKVKAAVSDAGYSVTRIE